MTYNDIPQEILDESLAEILDLIENIESTFLSCLKNERSIDDEKLNLMREIHSVKGAFGMIGFDEEMNLVHNIESYLDKAFSDNNSIDYEIIYEFWSNLSQKITGEPFSEHCLSLFEQACFPTPTECEDKCVAFKDSTEFELLKEINVILISQNSTLIKLFKNLEIDITQLNCINEVYKILGLTEKVNFLVIDLAETRVNPFLIHKSLKFLKDKPQIYYISSCTSKLLHYLKDVPRIPMEFSILGNIEDVPFAKMKTY